MLRQSPSGLIVTVTVNGSAAAASEAVALDAEWARSRGFLGRPFSAFGEEAWVGSRTKDDPRNYQVFVSMRVGAISSTVSWDGVAAHDPEGEHAMRVARTMATKIAG